MSRTPERTVRLVAPVRALESHIGKSVEVRGDLTGDAHLLKLAYTPLELARNIVARLERATAVDNPPLADLSDLVLMTEDLHAIALACYRSRLAAAKPPVEVAP